MASKEFRTRHQRARTHEKSALSPNFPLMPNSAINRNTYRRLRYIYFRRAPSKRRNNSSGGQKKRMGKLLVPMPRHT